MQIKTAPVFFLTILILSLFHFHWRSKLYILSKFRFKHSADSQRLQKNFKKKEKGRGDHDQKDIQMLLCTETPGSRYSVIHRSFQSVPRKASVTQKLFFKQFLSEI